MFFTILAALAWGCVVGGIAYSVAATALPQFLPFQAFAPGVTPGSTAAAAGGYTSGVPPPASATCSAEPGDDNTFVAELYKNGQLVTDRIA